MKGNEKKRNERIKCKINNKEEIKLMKRVLEEEIHTMQGIIAKSER